MIRIIDRKSEAKKYVEAISALFRIYRISGELPVENEETLEQFMKIIKSIKKDALYKSEPLKREIVKKHLLNGVPLSVLAEELCYSPSYLYTMEQAIMKDFAILFFKILIL